MTARTSAPSSRAPRRWPAPSRTSDVRGPNGRGSAAAPRRAAPPPCAIRSRRRRCIEALEAVSAAEAEGANVADYDLISGLEVDRALRRFVEDEVLPGIGIDASAFWFGFASLLRGLTPENKRLLRVRDDLQAQIDARNAALGGRVPSPAEEEAFLRDIGYL